MTCPCCDTSLRTATTATVSDVAGPGDLWCDRCRWLFAAEMLGPGGDPMALDGVWRCPTHMSQ